MHTRPFALLIALVGLAALLLAPAAFAGGAAGAIPIMNWTDVQFSAADGAAFDSYGMAVAIDGDTAVVGAPNHFVDTPRQGVGFISGQGAAYVYTRSGDTWTQQAELTVVGLEGQGQLGKRTTSDFGSSVAVKGDTIAVGAEYAGLDGAVYVFTRSGDVWTQQAMLTGTESAGSQIDGIVGGSSQEFGAAVNLGDDVLAVGAPGSDGDGAAYIFTRSGSTWTQQARFTSGEETNGHAFGASVSFDGSSANETLAVGAPGNWDVDGAAYVYVFEYDAWKLQATFTKTGPVAGATDAVVGNEIITDDFGASVSVLGDVLAVGSPSSPILAPAAGDSVGEPVASAQGAAYVYFRLDGAWSQTAKLAPDDQESLDRYGESVAVAGDITVFVGAPNRDVDDNSRQGVVYAYDWTGQVYQDPYQLIGGSAADEWMGMSLAVDDGALIAGGPRTTVGENADQGSAWLFTLPGPTAKVLGFSSSWQDRAVSLGFSGVTAEGGAAVDYTEYRIAGGAWTTGTSVRISHQGSTRVSYRSVDIFGTIGAARGCVVRIDTRRPHVVARAATAKAGTIARMTYKVVDPRPSSGMARMSLVVKNAAGRIVTKAATNPVKTNARHTVRIKALMLRPGTYRVLLHAVDRAGNAQRGWTVTTLTVR